MLALCCLYAASLILAGLLLSLYPRACTRFTATVAIAELIILACQTVLLAAVFLLC